MRRFVTLLALAAAWLSSGAALAQVPENAFVDGRFEVTEGEVRVVLDAVRAIGRPRIRTEDGYVRLWFPDMTGWANVDLNGDGGAVRFVHVRPGATDTSVVIVRLGDTREVPDRAVEVRRDGSHVVIGLAREALAPVRAPGEEAPAAAERAPSDASDGDVPTTEAAPAEAPARSAAEAEAPAAAGADATGSDAAGSDAAGEPAEDGAFAAPRSAADAFAGADTSPSDGPVTAGDEGVTARDATDGEGDGEGAPASAEAVATEAAATEAADHDALGATLALGVPASAGASNTTTLVLVTLVLGLALLAARQWQQRQRAADGPPIRVVASARLSQKQQLIVVRALGQDHLLSVDGGRTERLASIPAPDAGAQVGHGQGGGFGGGLEGDASSLLRLATSAGRAPAQDARAAASVGSAPASGSVTSGPVASGSVASGPGSFGAELLRLAREQQRGDGLPRGRGASAAVASLQAAARENASAAPATTNPSEAVAGLLRLRARAAR